MERLPEGLRINSSSKEALVFLKSLLNNQQAKGNFLRSLPEEKRLKAERVNFEELIREEFFQETFEKKWKKEIDPEWRREDKQALLALKEAALHTITDLILSVDAAPRLGLKIDKRLSAKRDELFVLAELVRFVLPSEKIKF